MPKRVFAFNLYARLALSAAYLSACADRLGVGGRQERPVSIGGT